MNEEEARQWLVQELAVPRGTMALLEQFASLLFDESTRQNLISRTTLDTLWARHIVDSAQLLLHAGTGKSWIDLGTGAGFPGIVIAIIADVEVTMVESRRMRIDYLERMVAALDLGDKARVAGARAELLPTAAYATISARAFAPIDRLLPIGSRFTGPETRWLLPKGRGAHVELEEARRTWQGDFRIEPSVTDPQSAIIVAEQVRPRRQR